MASMDYWATAPIAREQATLLAPTLDSMIAEDAQVRLFDEVLAGTDWTEWEAEYHGKRGQPPIHPRWVAACILYGLTRGIRSSRRLEYQCSCNVEFMWLVEGRQIDHSTIAKFRTRFAKPLKGLFRQVCQVAMSIGLIRLGEVAFDGTRVRANNGRYETLTAKTLEKKLQDLDALFDQMLAEAKTADEQQTLDGTDDSPTRLPPELADLESRRQQVRDALAKARAADEARKSKGTNPEENPAQVPTTDTDSRVMPNKEGGYAPNYTPTAITDGHAGFIIDADVLSEVNETPALLSGVERIEDMFGETPEKLLTDAGNNSGAVLQGLEDKGVEVYAPVEFSEPQPGNPAHRDDPTQPVPEADWQALPRNSKGKLAKSCFVFNTEEDQYYCPQGKPMPYEKMKSDERGGEKVPLRVYRCSGCGGCPLAAACLEKTAKHGRTITRDGFEPVRDRTAARMASEAGRRVYNQRPRIAEQPFGILKRVMDLRRFLLRGLEKVKTEWTWGVTAFNLGKLVRELARLRAEFAILITETEG
jgi:transposase